MTPSHRFVDYKGMMLGSCLLLLYRHFGAKVVGRWMRVKPPEMLPDL